MHCPKSTLMHRRRRKWRPYDGHDKPLINDIFNQLVNKNIRVETRDGEPEALPNTIIRPRRLAFLSLLSVKIEYHIIDAHRKWNIWPQ